MNVLILFFKVHLNSFSVYYSVKVSGALELELQRVLGIEPGSSGRAASALNR